MASLYNIIKENRSFIETISLAVYKIGRSWGVEALNYSYEDKAFDEADICTAKKILTADSNAVLVSAELNGIDDSFTLNELVDKIRYLYDTGCNRLEDFI